MKHKGKKCSGVQHFVPAPTEPPVKILPGGTFKVPSGQGTLSTKVPMPSEDFYSPGRACPGVSAFGQNVRVVAEGSVDLRHLRKERDNIKSGSKGGELKEDIARSQVTKSKVSC
eukprot:CAMPEP_0171860038 /NCGR_PEP_ID=MMETSP0992-20121227/26249_1 /TAXON_ID=483369 /ORGANISM="non described non described, Strain CCMP2098" /LENGTH=113 /DNA_ID=CAMNT_0012481793 /DNA_START=183 /DNA_END=525 /DNA_ORIENTATION=+